MKKSTHWHYNLMRYKDHLTLREVFVDEIKGEDDKISWTDPITFGGETREEVVEALEMALKDAKHHRIYNIDTRKFED